MIIINKSISNQIQIKWYGQAALIRLQMGKNSTTYKSCRIDFVGIWYHHTRHSTLSELLERPWFAGSIVRCLGSICRCREWVFDWIMAGQRLCDYCGGGAERWYTRVSVILLVCNGEQCYAKAYARVPPNMCFVSLMIDSKAMGIH